jgi:hypothetical protein
MGKQRKLSKSKLVAYRQCPKKVWLEVHHPELGTISPSTGAIFRTGHEVGIVAQRIYDPKGEGTEVDFKSDGVPAALNRTRELLRGNGPIFEAGFAADQALAFADVMLRTDDGDDKAGWRMVEVKSSTSVKPYQEDDAAIQAHIAQTSGVDLRGVAVAHIDTTWIYPGGGNYNGLLVEKDLTASAFPRSEEIRSWIDEAQKIVVKTEAPEIPIGPQCNTPFDCGFFGHCSASLPVAEYPVNWLPGRKSKALDTHIAETGTNDLRFLPDKLLNDQQRRVRDVTLSGIPYFDAAGAADALASFPLPGYFLDFETIQFGVPRWAGTHPYQMLPFQFSLHCLAADGTETHHGFLDLSGDDPSERFANSLIKACGEAHPIFVYNAGFEGARLKELAQRFSKLAPELLAIKDRLVDLLPITRNFFYHPIQKGSWSIKYVLPVVAPDLDYNALPGVHDGTQAMDAYLEAVDPFTSEARKTEIRDALEQYCALDTYAIIALWRFLTGATRTEGYP